MNEKVDKQGIYKADKFFFMSMEKRDLNLIGPMVLENFKNHVDGLYRYFMKDKIDKEPVNETLTEDIHKHFMVVIISFGVIGIGAWWIMTSFIF
jgi:hypothetical protein